MKVQLYKRFQFPIRIIYGAWFELPDERVVRNRWLYVFGKVFRLSIQEHD